MPKVSVIMPVYNGEDYLKESIDCILNQTLDDLELICVDDGSVDNSLAVLNEFAENDSRIQVFHQENKGGGAARNFAITKATGKYLYCMDADDSIKLTALDELYNLAEEKNLDMIIFQAINYVEDTGEYYHIESYDMNEFADYIGDKVFGYKDLGDWMFKINVTPWSKFYNLDFVKRSGAQFAEGLIFHDNQFFWEVLFNANRMYFLRKFLYIRRRHSASSTAAGDQRFVSTITVNNMIIGLFMKYGLWEKYRKKLYNRKIQLTHMRYRMVHDEHKEFFYNELKKDFEKMIGHERYDEFIKYTHPINKKRFFNVIESKDFIEFDLNNRTIDLEAEANKLKKQIKKYKNKNKTIINSTSWKITKPLRAFKRIFK
ncbi:glycosyltransferase [Methanobrevibacter sp.]